MAMKKDINDVSHEITSMNEGVATLQIRDHCKSFHLADCKSSLTPRK